MKNYVSNFPFCGLCAHKEKREGLAENEFYCPYAEAHFPNGIVTSDVDATDCVKKGIYQPIELSFT